MRSLSLGAQPYAVEQDALPGLAVADEELRELERQDDGLLERLLGVLQAGHVVPLDVRLLAHDGALEAGLHLGGLGVVRLGGLAAPASGERVPLE